MTTQSRAELVAVVTATTVSWISPDVELPDDDMTVLIALADGEVWTGFRDAGQWRYVSADPVETKVTYWAEFPEPPNDQAERQEERRQ